MQPSYRMASPRRTEEEIRANKVSANKKRKLRKLWSYSDLSFDEVCDEMEMSAHELLAYAASLGLRERVEPNVFIPSPEQIRVAAAEIRAGWSEADRESRLGAGAFCRMNNATEPHMNDGRGTTDTRGQRSDSRPEIGRQGD